MIYFVTTPKLINQPQTEAELEATGRCVARGRPYGGEPLFRRTAEQLELNQRCEAVKKWDWLRAETAKTLENQRSRRCLSQFFHSLCEHHTG